MYVVEFGDRRSAPFPIGPDVFKRHVWQPTLEYFLPIQMCHMRVEDSYHLWHGACHLDDARMSPINHNHFDGYSQGPSTLTSFKPGETVPGLNAGGWHDAGDDDLRIESQADEVFILASAYEQFHVTYDDTTVDEANHVARIHQPDGKPDILQQVEHGVLQVLGQFRAVGHSIPGIIEDTLQGYTHVGDAASKPGVRWAFTNRTTPLQYRSIAALAAASRVLKEHDPALAKECLDTAERVWKEEHAHPPALFRSFNTTGGELIDEEIRAAVELTIATKGTAPYRSRLEELLPQIRQRMMGNGWIAVRALPYVSADFRTQFEAAVRDYKTRTDALLAKNPFGVPIFATGWGGSGGVAAFGVRMYYLHRAFPQIVGPEYTLRAVNYLLGAHPVNSVSWVSGVGTHSKLAAYGNNRADFTFIPGGMVPGFVVVKPDFAEFKEDWPYFWYENEYVIGTVSNFILAANAADALVK